MIAESLALYLEDNNIGTLNENIFIGELPLDVNNCIALVYSPSPEPNKTADLFEQVIDIRGRFENSQDGYQMMLDILNLLHKGQNYSMEDYHIYFSNAMGMVDDLDRDSERRKLYRTSYRFIYRLDTIS